MSSLGQLVAGVAHEINNPINFIHGNIIYAREYVSDLLGLLSAYQHRYPDDDELRDLAEDLELDFVTDDLLKLLDSLTVGSDRIRDIVLSLRNFSRLDEAQFKPVDLHAGIDSTLLMLSSRLKLQKGTLPITIAKEYGDLPEVACHANQINQVVMNLIANAIDALEDISDEHWAEPDAERPKIAIRTRIRTDGQVEMSITDNALGIPEDIQSKIFDPFFTTKDVGRGTGLGLSICYKIVTEAHRGQLECDSTIGQGTTFRIVLPMGDGCTVPEPAATGTAIGTPLEV